MTTDAIKPRALWRASAAQDGPAAVDCADAATVERLYQATGRAALSKCELLVGRWDVAEEILQEVFLRLWREKPRFANVRQAYHWVYKACHRAGIDHLRAAPTRRERLPPGAWAESLVSLADLADAQLKRQLVVRLLRHLEDREAAILGYTVVDGMTQEEVAELMEISRKTVNRVCQRLAEKLAQLEKEQHHVDA